MAWLHFGTVVQEHHDSYAKSIISLDALRCLMEQHATRSVATESIGYAPVSPRTPSLSARVCCVRAFRTVAASKGVTNNGIDSYDTDRRTANLVARCNAASELERSHGQITCWLVSPIDAAFKAGLHTVSFMIEWSA